MSRDIIDIYLIELGLPQAYGGNIEANEIMSMDLGDSDPGAEAVKTMRRNRKAIGHKSGVSDYEITLEVKQVNPPEVDYQRLKRDRVQFNMYYEENEGGQRYRLEDCKVTGITKSANSDGEATLSVSVLPLDHVKEI